MLQREEDQLLLDQVFIQKLLVERANRAFQRVRHAEILGRNQLWSCPEGQLQNSAAHVDLYQVRNVVPKRFLRIGRGIQLHFVALQEAIDRVHKLGANRVQVGRRGPA